MKNKERYIWISLVAILSCSLLQPMERVKAISTEGEKYLLLNSGVGQGLLFAGNTHAPRTRRILCKNPALKLSAPRRFFERSP